MPVLYTHKALLLEVDGMWPQDIKHFMSGGSIDIGFHFPEDIVGISLLLQHLNEGYEEFADKKGIEYLLLQDNGTIFFSGLVKHRFPDSSSAKKGKINYTVVCIEPIWESCAGIERIDGDHMFGRWSPERKLFIGEPYES